MPNPYHDEAGRFSSKEEMGQAVDRLYDVMASADTPVEHETASDAWFNLRSEYEAAQKVESALAAATTFYRQGTGTKIGAPRELYGFSPEDQHWHDAYAEASQDNFAHVGQEQLAALANMLKKPSAPQELRDNFYKNAPAHIKERVMPEYLGHPLDDIRVSEDLARGLLENGGEGSNHLVSIALSSELPFDGKLALASRNNRLAYLAARAPHSFANDQHLELELRDELFRGSNGQKVSDEQREGWAALALASSQRSTIEAVQDNFGSFSNYDRKVMQELAQNPNLDQDQQVQVLQSAAWNDSQQFGVLAGRIAGSAYKVKTPERKELSKRLYKVVDRAHEIINGADSSAYVNLTPSELRSVRSELDHSRSQANPSVREKQRTEHFTALHDAQDGQYRALRDQHAAVEADLKKQYVEADYFANSRLARRIYAATCVRAADIAAGEYAEEHYSA